MDFLQITRTPGKFSLLSDARAHRERNGTAQGGTYIKIAGDRSKLATLAPGDCDCESNEPKDPNMPVEELGFAAAATAWLAYILTRGKTPRPPMAPIPPLVPVF